MGDAVATAVQLLEINREMGFDSLEFSGENPLVAALRGVVALPSEVRHQEKRSHPMNRIRAARQALGWTQNDLAVRAGISARTIHAIEKGRPCRQATKRKILRTLGVPWTLRAEYFPGARRVRPSVVAEEMRSA
jgi:DNA-binding XRE family transcriptional regulator